MRWFTVDWHMAWDYTPVPENWITDLTKKHDWMSEVPNNPQCGCGEPIERDLESWKHVKRRLDRNHPACLQLELPT